MTIQEMAQTVLELTAEDQAELALVGEAETATFEEYLSEYQAEALAVRMVCKGCHGG